MEFKLTKMSEYAFFSHVINDLDREIAEIEQLLTPSDNGPVYFEKELNESLSRLRAQRKEIYDLYFSDDDD